MAIGLKQIESAHGLPGGEPVHRLHPLLRERDPDFIRRVLPLVSALTDRYYRTELEGAEHLTCGPSLYVATHNGGAALPDLLGLLSFFWRRFAPEAPAYGLMHDIIPLLPGFGAFLRKAGGLRADVRSANVALRAGFPLLVAPGGDIDALKPFAQRHRVELAQRRGFVRLAIWHQVPIVPVVSVGAHEVMVVLHDGRRLAELTGLARWLRVKSLPVTLSFPFGLGLAGIPSFPLPAKVRIRVLPKIELGEPPAAADDRARVERCFEHVRAVMQRALDEMASRRRWPVLG
ncbi:MAG: 1-acyl-sn-glycerol-3-phosphate acyltransferase [Myxococcales bacterium]|jgi:1-acyl-sn-glycerol-3-phosphate acyltransferase